MWQYDNQLKQYISVTLPMNSEKITACYIRLSREDEDKNESESIGNQREFLSKYCIEHGFANPYFFSDDGFSGTNFNRPAFQELMKLVEQGKVETLIVKDHSRLGRNRLIVGAYMERFTEDYGIRYIAVTDGIDSQKGLDDMVAVRELFNEFYPRDTSKKIRSIFDAKGQKGERLCTNVLYGYTGNKHSWDIDPETAPIVQEIFALFIAGQGVTQIARHLTEQGFLPPIAYWTRKNPSLYANLPASSIWSPKTVAGILDHMEYIGCTVNFKMHNKSFKSKRKIKRPEEDRKIFPDTHPAIIDEPTWNRAKELRKHKRRPTKTGKHSTFSGLLYCADCGKKLYFCTSNSFSKNQDHFVCSSYRGNTGSCTAHFIREIVVHDLVLEHLKQTIHYVSNYKDDFLEALTDKTKREQDKQHAINRRELTQSKKRIAELDIIFQRIYEDNISGKISDERFQKLSITYENEQQELLKKVSILQTQMETQEEKAIKTGQFIALVEKYTDIQELTPAIANEFIEKIIVYAPDKSNGQRTQKVHIQYNFVGILPDLQTKNKTA